MGESGTGPRAIVPAELSAGDFSGWVGRPIAFAGARARLVLDIVEEGDRPGPTGRTPFALTFSGEPVAPTDPGFLQEGLYACGPEGEPAQDLYVVPVRSRSADRQDYQAVFC